VGELTIRPYRPSDAVALTDLINTIEVSGGGRAGWTVDDLASHVETLASDVDTDTRLVFSGDRLVGAGLLGAPPPGGHRVDALGGVEPAHRGRGIGRDLLSWQYQRARDLHDATDPAGTWQVESAALSGDDTARRLLERHGFSVARYFFDMVADSAAGLEPKLPAGLRSVVPDEGMHRAVYEAHMEAFVDHWGYQRRDYESWIALALGSQTFRPEQSRVALDGDQVAGYVLGYTDGDPQRLYIGQVGTRRPWRNRGLAGALLAEVLAASAAAGLPKASLGVDADSPTGAVGVYERAGFAVEHSFVAYRRPIEPTAGQAPTTRL
jgi:mycothiol synthase